MIPFSYNEDRCFFFPVDPRRAYAYWDYCSATWERLRSDNGRLLVMLQREGETIYEIEVPPETKNFYFNDLRPRDSYRMLLTIRRPYGLEGLMQSPLIMMPPDAPSVHDEVRYATFKFLKRRLRRRLSAEGVPVGRGYLLEALQRPESRDGSADAASIWRSWPASTETAAGVFGGLQPPREALFVSSSSLMLSGRAPNPAGAPDGRVWRHSDEFGKEGGDV